MKIKLKAGAKPINANRYYLSFKWLYLLAGEVIEVESIPKGLEDHVEIIEQTEAENGSQ
jgi:hypothetical protein